MEREALAAGDIHVLLFEVEPDLDASVDALIDLLGPNERARAALLRTDQARRAFIARRAVRRRLLGAYLGCPPERLSFVAGPYGKPAVENAVGLEFSVSASEGGIAFAFAAGTPVGIDVERVRDVPEWSEILSLLADPAAVEEVTAQVSLDGPLAFLRWWTQREAVGKMLGVGLTDGPAPAVAGLRKVDLSASEAEYAVALAYRGEERPVTQRKLNLRNWLACC